MPLTTVQTRHIASLARLALTDEEIERYRGQLSAILAYFEQLQAVDTSGVLSTPGGAETGSRLRADEVHSGLTLEDLLRNAPDVEADQFRVPPVFEQAGESGNE